MSANDKSSLRVSFGIVLINALLLFLTFRQMENAMDSATDASREASKADFRIRVARDETNEILKSIKEMHDDISTNFTIRKERPMVVIAECCNEVPVKSPGFVDAIELRIFEEFDQSLHGNIRQMRLRSKYAFVAQIENVGTGPALNTRVHWEVEKAIQVDGKITSLGDDQLNAHGRPHVWSALVSPGSKAMILHPPTFVTSEVAIESLESKAPF